MMSQYKFYGDLESDKTQCHVGTDPKISESRVKLVYRKYLFIQNI